MKREFLSVEEAMKMLPEGDYIHAFAQGFNGGPLIGADISKEEIISYLQEGAPELSGPIATAMKHGLVIEFSQTRLFIETKDSTP